ncbi:MAG: cupin domain-containing protein [bacterium]|nr:cupin domain-containing protein [bacterium]
MIIDAIFQPGTGEIMGVVHRFIGKDGAFAWEGVEVETYDRGGAMGGTKQVLLGSRDGSVHFGLRYYEIEPGGQSSFDRHGHDHGVYILRGKARVMLGWDVAEVGVGDVIYIPPNEEHQFENIGDEPLGFLCAVPPRD